MTPIVKRAVASAALLLVSLTAGCASEDADSPDAKKAAEATLTVAAPTLPAYLEVGKPFDVPVSITGEAKAPVSYQLQQRAAGTEAWAAFGAAASAPVPVAAKLRYTASSASSREVRVVVLTKAGGVASASAPAPVVIEDHAAAGRFYLAEATVANKSVADAEAAYDACFGPDNDASEEDLQACAPEYIRVFYRHLDVHDALAQKLLTYAWPHDVLADAKALSAAVTEQVTLLRTRRAACDRFVATHQIEQWDACTVVLPGVAPIEKRRRALATKIRATLRLPALK